MVSNAIEFIPDCREDRRRNKANNGNKYCKNEAKKGNKGKMSDRKQVWWNGRHTRWFKR